MAYMSNSALYISYAITEIFCIFFSIFIIIKANKNVGTELQMRHFRGMNLFFIIYLISDIIWAFGQGGMIPFSTDLNKITSAVGLVAVSLLILAWCVFVIYRFGTSKSNKPLIVLHYLVAAADCVLTISSIFTGYVFYINDEGVYTIGNGYNVHLALVMIQLFGSGIFSFIRSFRNKQAKLRSEYRLPLLFIIIPAIAAVLEGILPLTPIVPLGTFLPIFLAFLEIQSNEIYSDALTGLNNRRSMEIYLQDMIRDASNDNTFRIYMLDINNFKSVNDQHGHVIGDKALQIVARAIRRTSDRIQGYCARYGGDEFILITDSNELVQEAIQKDVNEMCEKSSDGIPKITICAGSAVCRSNTTSPAQLIAQADEQLYAQKQHIRSGKSAVNTAPDEDIPDDNAEDDEE